MIQQYGIDSNARSGANGVVRRSLTVESFSTVIPRIPGGRFLSADDVARILPAPSRRLRNTPQSGGLCTSVADSLKGELYVASCEFAGLLRQNKHSLEIECRCASGMSTQCPCCQLSRKKARQGTKFIAESSSTKPLYICEPAEIAAL